MTQEQYETLLFCLDRRCYLTSKDTNYCISLYSRNPDDLSPLQDKWLTDIYWKVVKALDLYKQG